MFNVAVTAVGVIHSEQKTFIERHYDPDELLIVESTLRLLAITDDASQAGGTHFVRISGEVIRLSETERLRVLSSNLSS